VPAEVLVVDDASRDGSPTLLRHLEAHHHADGLRVLAREQNGGPSAARNLALESARHRFIAFMDADDELVPESMPVMRRALVDTGAAVAYGNLLLRAAADEVAYGALSNEPFRNRMFDGNHIGSFAMVDRYQVLDAGGAADGYAMLEDHEQWLHLACAGLAMVFVPVVFGYVSIMPHSRNVTADQQQLVAKIRRVFNQAGSRKYLTLPTNHLRYHPAVGAL
jgi:glycosyltransferase involved in cell wall biosynthesis